MEPVGEHPVPAGPLAVRWLGYELPELRAGTTGTLRVRARNAGSATWRSRGEAGVQASYHWLDPLGNAIVWDGPRTAFAEPVAPGAVAELALELRSPRPPGRYRLAVDLVEEQRYWFAEVGSSPLELDVDVRPRIDERRLAVATAHLVAGAEPERDWSRRLLDAHAEGFVAVGGSVESRERALRPWAPGGGRNPSFDRPLLFPSLLAGFEPTTYEGLPAYEPGDHEPWLYDGRIRLRLPRGRRRA